MSQNWRFDPKWQIKIRFFHITLRASNIFTIFFLHSFSFAETQMLWKKSFSKIQDGSWNEKIRLRRHLLSLYSVSRSNYIFGDSIQTISKMIFLIVTHTEKIRNTDRGCRLWEVKNSGCKNSSPTEVKRSFIHQNLSIFIAKSMRNFCQTKSSPQNVPTSKLWNF
jgi:hypothetical protein